MGNGERDNALKLMKLYTPEVDLCECGPMTRATGHCSCQSEGSKATNPKDAIASGKLPLHLWPESATIYGTLGLLEGMLKYGRANWREAGVRVSVYIDALRRHIDAYFEGEDIAPDSGLPHLGHALACLAILVDAQMTDQLVDDRQYRGDNFRAFLEDATTHVGRLKDLHATKAPRHYTIESHT